MLSWFSTAFNNLFSAKTTDDLTEGSINLYDNQSWNETRANGLYAGVEWSYNETTATFDLYNATWDNRDMIKFVNDTGNIQNLLNATGIYSTYNTTYDKWAYNQSDGYSNETDLVLSVNTTGNIQNLLNATGIYSTFNVTYNIWTYNQTTATFTQFNATWDNRAEISNVNVTLYNLFIDYNYNQTTGSITYIDTEIGNINTTGNIQNLLNGTGIYSTYNATYDNKNTSQWIVEGDNIKNRNEGVVNITTNLSIGKAEIFEEGGNLIFR